MLSARQNHFRQLAEHAQWTNWLVWIKVPVKQVVLCGFAWFGYVCRVADKQLQLRCFHLIEVKTIGQAMLREFCWWLWYSLALSTVAVTKSVVLFIELESTFVCTSYRVRCVKTGQPYWTVAKLRWIPWSLFRDMLLRPLRDYRRLFLTMWMLLKSTQTWSNTFQWLCICISSRFLCATSFERLNTVRPCVQTPSQFSSPSCIPR